MAEVGAPTPHELRMALERIAFELECHPDAEHIPHIIQFAKDMANKGRAGFRAFLKDQDASATDA
jgi:hypothetical protein